MHFLCRLLGHRRDRRRIMPWRETWQTECNRCSIRLGRVRHGKWVPIRATVKTGSKALASRAKAAD
jgi:hypothetical protein